ncbi:MAG: cation:proton antiporter, partial [Myxococcota bacterium]|nr:cation:proton antiporter [Myxococcota bacterium]
MNVAILTAGLFVFLAHLLDVLFLSKKIPDILILMILGVLAGPVFGVVELSEIETVGKLVAVITLVVILFESGLNLSIRQVVGAAGTATPFALLSMTGAVGLMCGIFHLFMG